MYSDLDYNDNEDDEFEYCAKILEKIKDESDDEYDLDEGYKCKQCGCKEYSNDPNTHQTICNNCGYIIDIVDIGGNEEQEDSEDTYTKTGSVMEEMRLKYLPQSTMNIRFKGIKNKKLNNMQLWSTSYRERSLWKTINNIVEYCIKLGLRKCVYDEAINLYNLISNKIEDQKTRLYAESYKSLSKMKNEKRVITRGNNKKGIIGACIYYACKKTGYIKTVRIIAASMEITTAALHAGLKKFKDAVKKINFGYDINLTYPSQYINSLSNELRIKSEYIDEIKMIINKIEKENLIMNHSPYSIAISVVLMVLENHGYEIQKKELADKLLISIVTIHKTQALVEKMKDYLYGKEEKKEEKEYVTKEEIKKMKEELLQIDSKKYSNLTNLNIKDKIHLNIKEMKNVIENHYK